MKVRLILTLTAALLVSVAGVGTASATDEICQNADLTYTNQTGTDQTIYVTVFDEDSGETINESDTLTTLSPGETFDDGVRVDAPDEDGVIVIYSTQPLDDDQSNPAFFDRSDVDPCFTFNDGRLNGLDAAAPATVYNIGNQFIEVYSINMSTGDGTQWLQIPYSEVTATLALAQETGENQLIQERQHIAVYALSSGTCQMNVVSPGFYVFEWECAIG